MKSALLRISLVSAAVLALAAPSRALVAPTVEPAAGPLYQQMSEAERLKYIKARARQVSLALS